MKRFVILVIVFVFILATARPAFCQDPSPTPTTTPTPTNLTGITLSSGNTLIVEKTISFGDIAIVIAVLMLIVTILLRAFVEIPQKWLN